MKMVENLPPKSAFWSGFVGGILAVMAIGFVVTLPMALKGAGIVGGGDDDVVAAKPAGGQVAGAQIPPADDPTEPTAGQVKPVSKTDHIKGDFSKADVFLIEYSDMECPFCKRFHPTMEQVVQTYGTKVAWVYRHFPLSFHANAQKEAEASECVAELGGNTAFWKFTDLIYERTATGGTGFALTDLPKLAKELGLNEAKFKSCLDSGKYAQKVQQDMTEGQAAGVTGTPGTVLLTRSGETRIISGAQPFEQVKTTIDQYVQ